MLAINTITLAAGYLMRGMGLYWFIPLIFAMAWVAVLVSRGWLTDEFKMADAGRLSVKSRVKISTDCDSVIGARRTNVVESADSWNL